jgi:hypothetical protein
MLLEVHNSWVYTETSQNNSETPTLRLRCVFASLRVT